MALRLSFAPISQSMKAVLEKYPSHVKDVPLPELKKKVGPALASALNQLDVTLADLDKVTTIKGIDFSKPIDQFMQWDLLESELEPIMPGLTKKMKDLQLASGSHPFVPSFDEVRAPFEDKLAEMIEEAAVVEQTCGEIEKGLQDRIKAVKAEMVGITDVLLDDVLVKYPEINKQIEKELYLGDFKSLTE